MPRTVGVRLPELEAEGRRASRRHPERPSCGRLETDSRVAFPSSPAAGTGLMPLTTDTSSPDRLAREPRAALSLGDSTTNNEAAARSRSALGLRSRVKRGVDVRHCPLLCGTRRLCVGLGCVGKEPHSQRKARLHNGVGLVVGGPSWPRRASGSMGCHGYIS